MRFKDFVATDDDHEKMQIPRRALHAVALKFTYPKDEFNHFIAPLPLDLSKWLEEKLGIKHETVEKLIEERVKIFLS